VTAALAASAVVSPLSSSSSVASAASPGTLQEKITAGESRISALSSSLGAANAHVRKLGVSIAGLQTQIDHIQSNLDADRAELLQLSGELSFAQNRLVQLQDRERTARQALAQVLVADYESAPPNLVTVVLDSKGFSSLLEQVAFAKRINVHDQEVVTAVKVAQQGVNAQVLRLGNLERRQQALTIRVLGERSRVDTAKVALVSEQISAERTRDARAAHLATARGDVASLRRQLNRLEQDAFAVQLVSAGGHSAGSDPIPGFTIGRDDMGVDATAPTGTAIYAPLASRLVQVLRDWYYGQPLLLFQFANPPSGAPSDYWYVAEQINPITFSVGTTFQAGQPVASFASSGTGIEIGWGSPSSNSRTLAGGTDPGAASPPPGAATSWAESFKAFFGIG
jgi:peptidoglycan hydrolase CwlO-like protein